MEERWRKRGRKSRTLHTLPDATAAVTATKILTATAITTRGRPGIVSSGYYWRQAGRPTRPLLQP